MNTQANLIRKQYLVTEDNIQKLEKLASTGGTSAAEIVRQAIDAYDPDETGSMGASDLMKLVDEKLKEAITATRKASQKAAKVLKSLDKATA